MMISIRVLIWRRRTLTTNFDTVKSPEQPKPLRGGNFGATADLGLPVDDLTGPLRS